MKKLIAVRSESSHENAKMTVKCPCQSNPNYVRRNDRPALANIQSEAPKKQYPTVDYDQKTTSTCNKKSVSSCSKISRNVKQPSAQDSAKAVATSTWNAKSSPCSKISISVNPSSAQKSAKPVATYRCNTNSASCSNTLNKAKPSSAQKSKAVTPDSKRKSPYYPGTAAPSKPSSVSRCFPPAESTRIPNTGKTSTSCLDKLSTAPKLKPYLTKTKTPELYHKGSRNDTSTQRSSVSRKLFPKPTAHDSTLLKAPPVIKLPPSVPTVKVRAPMLPINESSSCGSSSLTRKISDSSSSRAESGYQSCYNSDGFTKSSKIDQFSSATLPNHQFVTLTQDTCASNTYLDPKTILGKVAFNRDSSVLLSEEERSFVDAEQFFLDADNGKCRSVKTKSIISPYEVTVPPRRNNDVSESSDGNNRKPAVKTTLKRRRSSIRKDMLAFLLCREYNEEFLAYCYDNRCNFLLKGDLIVNFVNKTARTNTLNWLLQITEYLVPKSESIFFMAVRLFDYAVIKGQLRKGHYQLAAIVCVWIALKYLDTTVYIKVPKIFAICSGKYSKSQVLSMERRILKYVNFCLNIPDPLDFLHKYLWSSRLENDESLEYGSKFILECASLFENYPLVEPSFLAACAVHMAYQIIKETSEVPIIFSWYNKEDSIRRYVERVLQMNVKYAIVHQYEPFMRYMTAEKLNIAAPFKSRLVM